MESYHRPPGRPQALPGAPPYIPGWRQPPHVATLGPSIRPQPPPATSVIGPIRLIGLIGPIYHPLLHPRHPTIPSRPRSPALKVKLS